MRPARSTDILTQHLTDGLHLLDISRLGERYLSQLISRSGGNNVRDGKRGKLALPPEIWFMIIEFPQADRHPGEYCLVRTSASAPASTRQRVRCVRYNFEGDPIKSLVAANRCWLSAIHVLEDFLRKPDKYRADDGAGRIWTDEEASDASYCTPVIPKLPFLRQASGPGSTFCIAFYSFDSLFDDPFDERDEGIVSCLFLKVTVPDIIAFTLGGDCPGCNNSRKICGGCVRPFCNDTGLPFYCGDQIVCPLCMGSLLWAEQTDYLVLRRSPRNHPASGEDDAADRRVIKDGMLDTADKLGYEHVWETELLV